MSAVADDSRRDPRPWCDVLVVDDDPASLRLITIAMREVDPGVTTHVLRRGDAALAFLRGDGEHRDAPRPDAVILDWNMPGLHGREVLDRIKADPDLRTIPVIVLSTSSDGEDVRAAYAGYANLYVTKAADFEGFVAMLEKLHGAMQVAERAPALS